MYSAFSLGELCPILNFYNIHKVVVISLCGLGLKINKFDRSKKGL